MLKPASEKKQFRSNRAFAIVASLYNSRYVDAMLAAAKAELKRAGVSRIQVVRVPGAFEIPVVAAQLAKGVKHRKHGHSRKKPERDALAGIICLGLILRGETVHAAHIGEAVSQALMQIQVKYRIPVVHEVLLLENEGQAQVRCLGKTHNRGLEAAQTALAMSQVMETLGGRR